jgi:hypothetical protein
MTTRKALSLHSTSLHPVECFLENLLIGGAAEFFARAIDPSFLERVLGGTISFIEDAEDAGEWELGQFVGGKLVGDIMTQFVLGRVVPFLFLDQLEGAALARVGRIKSAGEKFDALTQTFDDRKTGVVHCPLDHLHHVIDLRGMGPRDKGGAGCDQFFHGVDGLIDRALRVCFALEPDRRGGRGLFLRQAVDEVVHDEIGEVNVFACTVIEMIPADGKSIAVAPEEKDVEIGPGKTDTCRERDGASVNEMGTVPINEIRKTR